MRLRRMIRRLPMGNGGYPQWWFRLWKPGSYRSWLICNIVVPGFQFCLWVEW